MFKSLLFRITSRHQLGPSLSLLTSQYAHDDIRVPGVFKVMLQIDAAFLFNSKRQKEEFFFLLVRLFTTAGHMRKVSSISQAQLFRAEPLPCIMKLWVPWQLTHRTGQAGRQVVSYSRLHAGVLVFFFHAHKTVCAHSNKFLMESAPLASRNPSVALHSRLPCPPTCFPVPGGNRPLVPRAYF